jgi:hypothetical protein
MDKPEFRARYRSWAAFHRDFKQQISMRGLFVKTKTTLAQFAKVSVQLVTPDNQEFDLDGEVVQAMADQGLAVQFAPESAEAIDRLQELSKQHQPDGSEQPPDGDPQFLDPGQAGGRPLLGGDMMKLREQVEKMTVNQKRSAALHGKREMRLLMIRDRNKTVHPFVIKNPAITLDEIEQFAKMPSVNPDVLRMIAKNRDWTRSTAVCRALVRNPKTPMKEALMLLKKLPKSEIRALAKSGNVRMPIQQAARKLVVG